MLAVLSLLQLRAAEAATTVRVRCSQDVDEREFNPRGAVSTRGSDVDFGIDAPDGNAQLGSQLVGLTFSLDVPQGAVISAATLTLVAARSESTNAVGANIVWRANAADNAAGIPDTSDTGIIFGVSNRVLTSASMTWSNVPSFVEGNLFTTPDMSNVVQEVVNRPRWAPGNNFMLIAKTNANGGTFHRAARTGDANINSKAELTVTFSVAASAQPATLAPTPLPTPLTTTSAPSDVSAGGPPVEAAPVAAPIVAPVTTPITAPPVVSPSDEVPSPVPAGSRIETGSVLGGIVGVLAFASATAFFLTRRHMANMAPEEHTVVPGEGAAIAKGRPAPNSLGALGGRYIPSFALQTGAPSSSPKLPKLTAWYRHTFLSSNSDDSRSTASLGPAEDSPRGLAESTPRAGRGISFNEVSNVLVLDGRERGSTLASGSSFSGRLQLFGGRLQLFSGRLSSGQSVGYLP